MLKTVRDLGQKFNIKHVTNVITGVKSAEVQDYGHATDANFGIGKNKDADFWKSVIRVGILHGLIIKDIETYGLLKLGAEVENYLANPFRVDMSLDQKFEKITEDDFDTVEVENVYDEVLFAMLKDLTKKVGKQKGLPPYVIFQDPSLEDMATKYPIDLEEMEKIAGVGKNKAMKFGKPFCDMIALYVKEHDIERPQDIVIKTVANKSGKKIQLIQNIDKKVGIDVIAKSQGVSMDEMIHELEQIVYNGTKLNIKYYLDDILDTDRQEEILDYFKGTVEDDIEAAVKEFGGDYSPEELKLMRVQFISDFAN